MKTTKKHFHTIVIGGGPGGLACATHLARNGVDVLVLEKNRRIGPKVCAGGVTWSGLASRLPEGLIEKAFTEQSIRSTRQKTVVRAGEPIVSTVNRERLGEWMARQAVEAGVTLLTNTQVEVITGHEVVTSSECIRYNYLVGADGSSSMVRRFLKLPTERVGVGIHYQVPGDFAKMVWHLDPDRFNTGYAWIFPHRHMASVGAYVKRGDLSPSRLKNQLHSWMAEHGMSARGLKPEAALINFDYRGWRFDKTFLVGDAAGLASGLTGEGIYPAVLSGETVARTIIDPSHVSRGLERLIRKQQLHSRLLRLIGTNRFVAKCVLESLVTALKLRILHFSTLEMGE